MKEKEYCEKHKDIELRNRKDKKGKYCRICMGIVTEPARIGISKR